MGHGCRWGLTAAIRALRAPPQSLLRGSIPRDLGIGGATRESRILRNPRIRALGRPLPAPARSDRGTAWMPEVPTPPGRVPGLLRLREVAAGVGLRQGARASPGGGRLPPAGRWSSHVSGQRSASPKPRGAIDAQFVLDAARRSVRLWPENEGLTRDLAASRCRSKPGYRGTPVQGWGSEPRTVNDACRGRWSQATDRNPDPAWYDYLCAVAAVYVAQEPVVRPREDDQHLEWTNPNWCQKRTGIPRTMRTADRSFRDNANRRGSER
jgi:hypothetical protein